MARVPLVDENATPEIAALSAKIRGARGGTLHAFYRALMHTPDLACAWFDFNNAVRFRTGLDDRTRELVIIRVAMLNGVEYVVNVHREQYAEPAGVSREAVDALANWRKSRLFSRRDRAVLRYTDAITRDVAVHNGVFARLQANLDTREIVEVTVLIAAYNMHTRLLMALDIRPEKE